MVFGDVRYNELKIRDKINSNQLLPIEMKKNILLFLILMPFLVFSQPRNKQTINSGWKFHKSDIEQASKSEFDDKKWENIIIPHTWNIEDIQDDPYGWYRGPAWYRKQLKIEPWMTTGKQIYLCFEAANQVTTVYINGEKAGQEHIGGYTPFKYDITNLVQEGYNTVAIKVDNSYNENITPLLADFVFYGGIYRDISLLITEKNHFDILNSGTGIFITTPSVSEKEGIVAIRYDIQSNDSKQQNLIVDNTVIDHQRNPVAKSSQKIKLKPGEKQTGRIKPITIKNPWLWGTENPYLYTVVSEIKDNKGNVIDRVENPLGFRWFSFDKDKGFFLNGKHVKLIGTNRHQDYINHGNALTRDMHLHDMQMLKDLGTNCLRISHYPHDPVVLEMCDRLGLIAFEEIPIIDWITQSEEHLENCKKQISEMIRRDFNHPCIVAWNSSNESNIMRPPKMIDNDFDRYERDLSDFLYELDRHIKQEDDSRYSMVVLCGNIRYNISRNYHSADVIGYNKYEGWYENDIKNIWNVLHSFKELDPEHPLVLTEYGAGADYRIRTFNPKKFDHSVEYQVLFNKEHLKACNTLDFVAGSTIWNFADFYSEGRGETQPHINNKGIVTLDRKPKDSYYYFKTILSKTPYVSIPSQLWTNRSGREDTLNAGTCTQAVEVFANTNEVELFLNGESLGKKTIKEWCATYDIPFVNGENLLELVAFENGQKVKDFLRVYFKLQPCNLQSTVLPFDEIAINVGSHFYFINSAKNNYLWLPDQEYTKGSWGYIGGKKYLRPDQGGLVGSRDNIRQTTEEPLYQTQQVGLEAYKIDVPEGNYEVSLLFAEFDKNIERIFDIFINGILVQEDVNIMEQYGSNTAVSVMYAVFVKDENGLTVSFKPKQGETILNGINVRKVY